MIGARELYGILCSRQQVQSTNDLSNGRAVSLPFLRVARRISLYVLLWRSGDWSAAHGVTGAATGATSPRRGGVRRFWRREGQRLEPISACGSWRNSGWLSGLRRDRAMQSRDVTRSIGEPDDHQPGRGRLAGRKGPLKGRSGAWPASSRRVQIGAASATAASRARLGSRDRRDHLVPRPAVRGEDVGSRVSYL